LERGGDVISERLSLDLSELKAQAQQFQLELRQADARAEMAHRRIQSVTDSVNELDRRSSRVIAQVQSKIRGLAREGVRMGVASAVGSIDVGDDEWTKFAVRATESALYGGIRGGLPGALAGFGAQLTVEGVNFIVRKLKELEEKQREQQRRAERARAELEELHYELRDLDASWADRMAAIESEVKEEAEKLRRDTEELDYQTSQYVE
jgi:chromosome segregation ATPase